MPNGFAVIPNVLPGNVTVGGNLTVSGDVIRIGAAVPFVRIGKDAGGNRMFSHNIGADNATIDTGAFAALRNTWATGNAGDLLERTDTLGNKQVFAPTETVWSDFVAHGHTTGTALDTVISKVLRGGTMGANGGLFGRLIWSSNVQGAPVTTVQISLGGVAFGLKTFNTADTWFMDFSLVNRNNASSQLANSKTFAVGAAVESATQSTPAINTAADQTLAVQIQNGTGTDSQTVGLVLVQLVNTFGPV
jgi:hypothetical protein